MDQKSLGHILAYMAAKYGGPPQVATAIGKKTEEIFDWRIQYIATGTFDERIEIAEDNLNASLFDTKWPKSWYRSPALISHLNSVSKNLDILHIHEMWSNPQYAAARLAKSNNIPYIITPHGELEPWRVRRKQYKKRPYLKLLGRGMMDGAHCLHAITRLELDGFWRVGFRGAVTVVPNGVNPEDYQDLPSPEAADVVWPQLKDKRTILFLSRLSKEKGLDILLPAWSELQKGPDGKDAILVLAGPDDRGYARVVKDLIDDFDLHSSVLLPGMVTGEKKKALLSRAEISILPSYSEGFSISILENMIVGNPLIITKGCNFPEVERLSAGICTLPKSGDLHEALKHLLTLSNKDLEKMGNAGKEIVLENYTWEIAARKMMTVYNRIIEGKKIPLYPEPTANLD